MKIEIIRNAFVLVPLAILFTIAAIIATRPSSYGDGSDEEELDIDEYVNRDADKPKDE